MAWYDEAVFYHIYPLGMTGAPKQNPYGEPVHRLNTLLPWISHIGEIGCNAVYIGPLFESVGHGYETTDYKRLDSRLGTNGDLANFVAVCHENGIRVILDGVFNHTGRDFFAFKDIKKNRESSPYKDWYCNVNFCGNNSYNDGFSYENWGGHDLLVKLNQKNPDVKNYICDVIRFWVSEFDIDGIRLDAADVMDFDYMKALRQAANEVKDDFWLMGEVIHGNYSRWANDGTLHSVTNYMLHKALYSAHNDRNYFEIAHTVKYVSDMTGKNLKLYTFTDNHDVERIYTKLKNKAHFAPVHIMLYTLPGIPSVYYGSEFGIEGKKEHGSDDSLRPELRYEDYRDEIKTNPCTQLISALGKIRRNTPALYCGDYKELILQNTYFVYERVFDGKSVIITVNNADTDVTVNLSCVKAKEYVGALSGERVSVTDGKIQLKIDANYGEIWLPDARKQESPIPIKKEKTEKVPTPIIFTEKSVRTETVKAPEEKKPDVTTAVSDKPYEEMTVEELQSAILEKMKRNGPVTDYMLGTVMENRHHGSLVNWVKSFQ
ncbi:MAG: alpha-amylase [Clostridia bacterium]|nr:alpha-amylase [Clostridia bacterium]